MKKYLLVFLITSISITLFGQSNDPWFRFYNKDSTLIGFKDKKGTVKIKPKFTPYISAKKFDDIIAVTESRGGRYYLTKAGRIVGKDNLYYFDNSSDCECEGYIRFRDSKTQKMGMFNSKGDIAIPAIYNYLDPVRNGIILAQTGAHRYKGKQDEHSPIWEGGKYILINTSNKTLIDNIKVGNDFDINFYSLLISAQPNKSNIRRNFKGVDGKFYSFVIFDKEFRNWLNLRLLKNFTKSNLLNASNKYVIFSDKARGSTIEKREIFVNRNFNLMKSKLSEINNPKSEYYTFHDLLNPYEYTTEEYQKYFNNCGQSKDWIYPVKSVVINHKKGKDLIQDHFDFLRTDNGYKLISVDID